LSHAPSIAGSAPPLAHEGLALRFRGQAREYIRIWLVNVALTVATLGLYGPWARVRLLRYLHGHTQIGNHSFDYEARPGKILFARLLMLLLLALLNLGPVILQGWARSSGVAAGIQALLSLLVLLWAPWLAVQALRFRARCTSFRHVRFHFGVGGRHLWREAVLLSTCNRVELYAVVEGDPRSMARRLREFLSQDRRFAGDLAAVSYTHFEGACLTHLFRVAGGLDSIVLGETEILGQLKKAYDSALRGGHTGKALNQAFQRAFSVGKQLRSETQIQRGNTSVASVAVELAEKIFDDLRHREVIILGAGEPQRERLDHVASDHVPFGPAGDRNGGMPGGEHAALGITRDERGEWTGVVVVHDLEHEAGAALLAPAGLMPLGALGRRLTMGALGADENGHARRLPAERVDPGRPIGTARHTPRPRCIIERTARCARHLTHERHEIHRLHQRRRGHHVGGK
jgi:hypothetical protein